MAKTTYTTVTDVPLIRVGQWMPSEGDGTVTVELLEQMVAASQDPRLNLAVIKIGHTDDRFDNPDYFKQDGEPAYGQITNLRVTDDEGGTLVGDFINIPEDLAEKMASAYPHRSVEFVSPVVLLDETGTEVEEFPCVLTAVALLGDAEPAVSGLGSIHEAFSKQKVVHMRKGTQKYTLKAGHTFGSLRDALHSVVRGLASESEWAWVRDLDDTHVIYEVETGTGMDLYKHEFAITENGAVELVGEPVQVYERRTFEPATDTPPVPQGASLSKEPVDVKPSTVAAPTTDKEATMATSAEKVKKLREQLGLSDDVTDEQILAALKDEEVITNTEVEVEVEVEVEGEAEVEAEADKVAASKAVLPETVQVSAVAFSQLQSEHKAMAARFAKLEADEAAKRRDGIIASAFSAGKLHPSEKAAYRAALNKDEDGTKALLEARHPIFNTRESGAAGAAFALDAGAEVDKALADIDSQLFGKGK